jgi:thioredoxin:protein disulfide reductase
MNPSTLDLSTLLSQGQLLTVLPVIFLAGVATSLTPCVYPLIPITVNVFGAREARGKAQAAAVSGSFVLGIAAMFSSLGLVAAATGKAFGSFLGNPFVVIGLAAFFVVMAFSMMGAFELNLPVSWQTRLSMVGGAGYGGAFLMGLVSGVVAAPCTGPVLASILAFVAGTQNMLLGFIFLFVYALGVGALFFVIGVYAVRLPKGGPWMDAVKAVFAIALLVTAAYFLRARFSELRHIAERVDLYGSARWAAVAALFIAGVLLGAFTQDFHGRLVSRLRKTAGVFVCALAGVGVLEAVENPLDPGKVGDGPYVAQVSTLEWLSDERAALARAATDGKPVIVDFGAEWCAACKELEHHGFTDAAVRRELEGFVRLKVDATEDTDAVTKLQDKYRVVGLPSLRFVAPDGTVLKSPSVDGFNNKRAEIEALARTLAGVRTAQSRKL